MLPNGSEAVQVLPCTFRDYERTESFCVTVHTTCTGDERLVQIKGRLVGVSLSFERSRLLSAHVRHFRTCDVKPADEVGFGRRGGGEFDLPVQCSKRCAGGSHVCMASTIGEREREGKKEGRENRQR